MASPGRDTDPWVVVPDAGSGLPPRWHRIAHRVAIGFVCLSLPVTLVAFAYLAGEPANEYQATHPTGDTTVGILLRVCVLVCWLVAIAAASAPSIAGWLDRRRRKDRQ